MLTFPALIPVSHKVFTGTGEDSLGNDVETWAAAVTVNVIAFQPSSAENVNGYSSRVVAEVDMAVPPTLAVTVRDRFALPGYADADTFEVVAIEDANHGFHGWKPGNIVKLKKVTG